MIVARSSACLLVLLALATTGAAAADRDEEQTIKSLEDRRIDVEPGGRIEDSADKARDNYRQFLDLVSDDPALRAEAMRRLADLDDPRRLEAIVEALAAWWRDRLPHRHHPRRRRRRGDLPVVHD